jgi:hypothetical protein
MKAKEVVSGSFVRKLKRMSGLNETKDSFTDRGAAMELSWRCQTFLNQELKKNPNPNVSLDFQIDGGIGGIAVISMSQSSSRYLNQRIGPSYFVSRLRVRDLWEISTKKSYIPSFRRVPG